MERIKRMKARAEEKQKRTELKIEKLEQALADKEIELSNKKIADRKFQAQKLHELDLKKRQEQQDQMEYAKTPKAKTREAYRQGKEIKDRDISRGLTKEERAKKYMDSKTSRECDNAIAQGEVKDVTAFLKRQRLRQEERDRNWRRSKGL